MFHGTRCSPAMWRAALLFALPGALGVAACSSGPLRPSDPQRFSLYSGTWRTSINGWEVVLQMEAVQGFAGPALLGSGSARNEVTGETHILRIAGDGTNDDSHGFVARFDLWADPYQPTPGSSMATNPGGRHTGWFTGNVLGDGRTWPGRWSGTNVTDPYAGLALFGAGSNAVMWIKQ